MAQQVLENVGGYDITLVSILPQKYKCPICGLLMRDAIQTYRGEMACESCYLSTKGSGTICPLDNEPTEDGEFFNDMHARREILQLECYCMNKKNGCTWQGVINELKEHPTSCPYKEISCTKCHDIILRKDADDHEANQCKLRSINCRYCKETFDAQTMQDHEPSCNLKPMECPFHCEQTISLRDLYDHVQNCQNVSSGKVCPYQAVGCQYEPKNSADLMDHLKLENKAHAAFAVSVVAVLRESNEKIKQDLMSEQALRIELAKKVEEQANEKIILSTEVEKIQNHLSRVQGELTALHEKCDSSVAQVKENLNEIDLRVQQANLEDIEKKLSDIGVKYNELEGKLTSAFPGATSMASKNFEAIEQEIGKLDRLESGSAILSANLSDLELKLQLLENTTYEGVQLWKIDNIAFRTNQAVTGKVTALHSAPCFQCRGGYKFCSRLYLNGDGMGRGTHVSLFFVVMKSEYDNLLQWPFRERVTFRVINPYNSEETIEESFLPDQNSSSFKRPTKDMNIAAGCPMFIKKEKLIDFIVDDCIYIETSITSPTVPV